MEGQTLPHPRPLQTPTNLGQQGTAPDISCPVPCTFRPVHLMVHLCGFVRVDLIAGLDGERGFTPPSCILRLLRIQRGTQQRPNPPPPKNWTPLPGVFWGGGGTGTVDTVRSGQLLPATTVRQPVIKRPTARRLAETHALRGPEGASW